MKKIKLGVIILGAVVLLIGSTVLINTKKKQNSIVARYITDEHYRYSPVELYGEVYFPSSVNLGNTNELKSLGFLSTKDKGIINDSFFLVGSVLVEENDKEINNFSIVDDFSMNYTKGDYLNDENIINKYMDRYNEFVIVNDNHDSETRSTIEKDILYSLQDKFKDVEYIADDFKNSDSRYYIYVNSPKEKIHNRSFDNPIIFIGCILIKDNKFYYGNLNNEINGELFDKLKPYIVNL